MKTLSLIVIGIMFSFFLNAQTTSTKNQKLYMKKLKIEATKKNDTNNIKIKNTNPKSNDTLLTLNTYLKQEDMEKNS